MPQDIAATDAGVITATEQNDPPSHEATARQAEGAGAKGGKLTASLTGAEETAATRGSSLMDRLGVPAEVQAELATKQAAGRSKIGDGRSDAEKPKTAGEDDSAEAEAEQTPTSSSELPSSGEEPSSDLPTSDEEPPGDESGKKAEAPKAPKEWPAEIAKEFNKRIGKVWKQRRSAEDRAYQLEEALQTAQGQIQEFQQGQASAQNAAPRGSAGVLGNVTSEAQLNQFVAEAQHVMDWADDNADGATVSEGKEERFIEPQKIAKMRRDAERVLLGASDRRMQLREFHVARQHFDSVAQSEYPDLFDPQSEDYQRAQAVLRQLPWLAQAPERNVILGDFLAGMHTRVSRQNGGQQARQTSLAPPNAQRQNGRGWEESHPGESTRDLDPRFTAPRAPIAPHTAKPPGRSAAPSQNKKVDGAMNNVVASGGDRESLTAAIRAMREAGEQTVSPRSAVEV